ncbi:hypothetical protein [Sphingomonas sanguinis]|uniref:hypothetical protein n=1 Tax=Sphingomonas sanguinis TaxID=33051 RepID=UPI00128EF254|nr:hypothetical protein [Sphingomonas sanguinis]
MMSSVSLIRRLVLFVGCSASVTLAGAQASSASLRCASAVNANSPYTERTPQPKAKGQSDLTSWGGRWVGQARVQRPGHPALLGHAFVFVCWASHANLLFLRRIINLNDGSKLHDSLTIAEPDGDRKISFWEYPSHVNLVLTRDGHRWLSDENNQRLNKPFHSLIVENGNWVERWNQTIHDINQLIEIDLTQERENYKDDTWADAIAHPQIDNQVCR